MMSDNAKRLMKELGFSEDKCSVYFELLNKPTGDSIEGVLSQSKIGSHETQEAVKSLVEKGLLRITSNRLEAAEPKIFVSKIQEMNRQELTRKLETLSENASQLLSILEPLFWETFSLSVSSLDRKSTRLNSSHRTISYAVFCLKKKI